MRCPYKVSVCKAGFDFIISQVYINCTEYLPISGVFGDGDGDDDGDDGDGDGDGDGDDDGDDNGDDDDDGDGDGDGDGDDNDNVDDGSGGRVVDVAEGATSSVSKYSARNPRSGENDE